MRMCWVSTQDHLLNPLKVLRGRPGAPHLVTSPLRQRGWATAHAAEPHGPAIALLRKPFLMGFSDG